MTALDKQINFLHERGYHNIYVAFSEHFEYTDNIIKD